MVILMSGVGIRTNASIPAPIGARLGVRRALDSTMTGPPPIVHRLLGKARFGVMVKDPETDERVRKEVPLRLRRWWWKDEKGGLMLDVRYGNKRIELAPKKPTIEVGDTDNLVPTLETIKEAVIAGELDKQLAAAKQRRKRQKA